MRELQERIFLLDLLISIWGPCFDMAVVGCMGIGCSVVLGAFSNADVNYLIAQNVAVYLIADLCR